MPFCRNCGTKLENDYLYCSNCSNQLSSLETEETEKKYLRSIPAIVSISLLIIWSMLITAGLYIEGYRNGFQPIYLIFLIASFIFYLLKPTRYTVILLMIVVGWQLLFSSIIMASSISGADGLIIILSFVLSLLSVISLIKTYKHNRKIEISQFALSDNKVITTIEQEAIPVTDISSDMLTKFENDTKEADEREIDNQIEDIQMDELTDEIPEQPKNDDNMADEQIVDKQTGKVFELKAKKDNGENITLIICMLILAAIAISYSLHNNKSPDTATIADSKPLNTKITTSTPTPTSINRTSPRATPLKPIESNSVIPDNTNEAQVSVLQDNNFGFKKIEFNGYSCLALKSDGTVWTWGQNNFGQLGDGTTIEKLTPFKIPGLKSVIDISSSGTSAAAITQDGSLWCWGFNRYYELGNGKAGNVLTPEIIDGLPEIKSVKIYGFYSMGLDTKGNIWGWGNDEYGQSCSGFTGDLDPMTLDRTIITPQIIFSISDVMQIESENTSSYAIRDDGTVWSWGYRNLGYDVKMSTVPLQITSLNGIIKIQSSFDHCLALSKDGKLYAWGSPFSGCFMKEFYLPEVMYPELIVEDEKIIDIKTGSMGGTVYKVTDGTWYYFSLGKELNNIGKWNDLEMDINSFIALDENGSIWVYGNNEKGQLGNGTKGDGNIGTEDNFISEFEKLAF